MKPDSNNPGSIMPEQSRGHIKVKENTPRPADLNSSMPTPSNESTTTTPNKQAEPLEASKNSHRNKLNKPEETNSFIDQLSQLTAEDSDVIEQEWVDQVDHVIGTTQNDPYFAEQGHHELSRKYLKRRFNLDIE